MSILLILVGLGELSDIDVLEHGPEEADELAGDGGGGHLPGLPGRESVKDFVEPVLTLPGVGDDRGVLALLPPFERSADGGPPSVTPGGLDEHVSATGVAGLGDGALPPAVAGGVLAGHQAEVGHELAGILEAAEVAELGGQNHGCVGLEASEAGDAIDDGLVAGVRANSSMRRSSSSLRWSLYSRRAKYSANTVWSSSARVPGWRTWRIQFI